MPPLIPLFHPANEAAIAFIYNPPLYGPISRAFMFSNRIKETGALFHIKAAAIHDVNVSIVIGAAIDSYSAH